MKKIHIQVEEDVWEHFLEYIRSKHDGKIKGLIWPELKNAILQYMKRESSGNSYVTKYGVTPSKALRIVDAIGSAIIEKFKTGKTVTISWVEEFIKLNVSPNPSIIEKYMRYFKEIYKFSTWENKYIKPWTFHRKDKEPLWKTEEEYLQWLQEHKISTTWIKRKERKENEEINEILNAEITD